MFNYLTPRKNYNAERDFWNDFMTPFFAGDRNLMKTDIRETENEYILDIELPGFAKEDLKVSMKDGYLTVQAGTESEKNEDDKEKNYIRRERFSGSYSRSFYVGDEVKETDIKAKYDNGVLQLSIPKIEAKPNKPETKYIAIE